MNIELFVNSESICKIALNWDDAPNLSQTIMDHLPVSGRITHAKLSGSVIFFTLPFIAPWENFHLFEDVPAKRPGKNFRGAVCLNNAAQHFCLAYSDDVIDEPLGMSYVGDVVEGLDKLESIGIQSWLHQGYEIELRAISA